MLKRTLILFPAALLLLLAGCSSIDGSVAENRPPTVEFVNNQEDADLALQSFTIPDYAFIFPDRFQGFEEDELGALPDTNELNVEARFELIRFQYFGLTEIREIIEDNAGVLTVVPSANYRIDPDIPRYIWLQNTADFHWKLGPIYRIDGDFEYRPVHSYAPLVFWRGTDPDGFIEMYRYYDHVYEDEASLAAFQQRVNSNDPTIEWIETRNTQATVNLTTELGRIQKHMIFVQAIDNDGLVSPAATRVFNRSNRAPYTPKIAFYKDGYTRVSQPDEYERHIIDWEDVELPLWVTQMRNEVSPYYEVPVSPEPLESWEGLRFLVTGSDPDDQALLTIPLQFQYRLFRLPDELVASEGLMDWSVAQNDDGIAIETLPGVERLPLSEDNVLGYEEMEFLDEDWTSINQIDFFNLESGFYQLSIYSRDDGYEACALPAWMRFRAQQVSMERDILVLDLTPPQPQNLGYESVEAYQQRYRQLIEELLPGIKLVTQGEAGYMVDWMEGPGDMDYNSRWWTFGDPEHPLLPPFSVLSQYHTVICLDDKWATGSGGGSSNGQLIANPFKGLAMDYLDMGGSLLWSGYSSMMGTFNYAPSTPFTNSTDQIANNAGDFLRRYFGIERVYGDIIQTFVNGRGDACLRGMPLFTGLDTLRIDPVRIAALRQSNSYNQRYYNPESPSFAAPAPDSSLIYIEAFGINEGFGTQAYYTYDSYSAGLEDETSFDFFRVADAGDLTEELIESFPAFPADPSPTGCWLYIPTSARNFYNMTIFEAYSARNLSRPDSMWANPQFVTSSRVGDTDRKFIYVNHQRIDDPAERWAVDDTVRVALRWDPVLVKHRKPLVTYTENLSYQAFFAGIGVNPYFTNFRTAYNQLPLHLLELGEAPDWVGEDSGSGARGLLGGVLLGFYQPKLQDILPTF
jgi:hypothetical protein